MKTALLVLLLSGCVAAQDAAACALRLSAATAEMERQGSKSKEQIGAHWQTAKHCAKHSPIAATNLLEMVLLENTAYHVDPILKRNAELEKQNDGLIDDYNKLVAEYNQLLAIAKTAAAIRPRIITRTEYVPVAVPIEPRTIRCNSFSDGMNTTTTCR